MQNHYFTTTGDKDSGIYIVHECKNGLTVEIGRIKGEHYRGLKKARQLIGRYLVNNYGYSLVKVITHQTIVQGRKNNPIHHWTVEQYLIGVPPSNLKEHVNSDK